MGDAQLPGVAIPAHDVSGRDVGRARVPEAVRAALIARGHKLKVGGPWTMGSLAAIVVEPKTGVLSAGTDPRVDAYAIAW